uniref:Uncharacterized protein n=1 Tax=Arundo donax TaxID=35708 RepID=A0A0A9BC11_ARUDO
MKTYPASPIYFDFHAHSRLLLSCQILERTWAINIIHNYW